MTWGLPFDDKNVWYHGQSLAINDCLYRHMNDFHHIAFIDLDEIIVPKGDSQTWNDVMTNLKTTYGKKFTDASAFSFKTAFFSPEFSRHVYSNELGTVVRTNRTLHFSYRRHKLIVRPERIFELGIHHVSRSWPDDIQHENLVVPKEIAFIHHYRACVQEFGIHCNMRLQDFDIFYAIRVSPLYNQEKAAGGAHK
ncbi:GALT1-like protein [Mya arenaria]|uniref:Glycosyltransferase family 92 protein n=1 Tax=Mya arenaria TaxID=6604 RepID=A0ABY7FFL3_MYAAR|nr:GALT1-like protein [Mya arenaria]